MSEFITPATQFIDLPLQFYMHRGGSLIGGRVAYECWGTPNPTRSNVILILTGLSPSARAANNFTDLADGWREGMIGPGK